MNGILTNTDSIFARRCCGGFTLHYEDGTPVRRLDTERFRDAHTVYPVNRPDGQALSAAYEQPTGLILSADDVQKLGIPVE